MHILFSRFAAVQSIISKLFVEGRQDELMENVIIESR